MGVFGGTDGWELAVGRPGTSRAPIAPDARRQIPAIAAQTGAWRWCVFTVSALAPIAHQIDAQLTV